MKKSTVVFIFMSYTCGLFGMKLFSWGNGEEKMEQNEVTRGETVFNEFLSYVNENEKEKKQIVERVALNVTDVCYYKAKNSLDEINGALAACLSGLGFLFLNLQNAEKKRGEVKKTVLRILNKSVREADGDVLDHFGEYKKLFTEKLVVADEEALNEEAFNEGAKKEKALKEKALKEEAMKDALCMSVHLGKENKDDFKSIVVHALRRGVSWGWVQNIIHDQLVKNVFSIEEKINKQEEEKTEEMKKK